MSVNLTRLETSLSAAGINQLSVEPATSLYLHVPFCPSKCQYCDFYSIAQPNPSLMAGYVACAKQEILWWHRYLQKSGSAIATVFLGGGTPTVLPSPLMADLLRTLRKELPFADGYEWTVEANPATVDPNYCTMLLDHGVNRISFGAQSFIEEELRILGRAHGVRDVIESVATAQRAGFKRINVDLMYATPGQTLDTWIQSLQATLDMGIGHISCYCLTLEESTPMYRRVQSGEIPRVSEDSQLQYMKQTRSYLATRGLEAYEISNYALPGQQCRHNLAYWDCANYIGIGPGAASHIAGVRWRHAPDVARYTSEMRLDNRAPLVDVEELSPSQRGMEMVMMSLRTRNGLSWARYHTAAGVDGEIQMGSAIEKLRRLGMLERFEGGIRLTAAGVYVADEVIRELVGQAS